MVTAAPPIGLAVRHAATRWETGKGTLKDSWASREEFAVATEWPTMAADPVQEALAIDPQAAIEAALLIDRPEVIEAAFLTGRPVVTAGASPTGRPAVIDLVFLIGRQEGIAAGSPIVHLAATAVGV